ncbi:EscR/YscR/HrcR family type III secretion system export apparatus protein [Salmonella enterica]|nr:EscR/YscR/HrcR family type III secretion system export apparatus protein [Salmonella enterica]ECJ2547526.1 EscR/YscR/HrcR family type III secretion system export apparatus protein [Salmonella enterica subsp. arizonae]EAB4961851.1 EscR/YscR/HrcR family type III secretion system export apparatus protein [Salmonella enterica]EAZ5906436.1 EscR/YscR/HrcR family type III secretion system export apparatus protein [Salmonella enterica]EBQ4932632.1 EscR/YscR/HrcR family type III secretion system expo
MNLAFSDNQIILASTLFILSLAPFLIIIGTPFLKFIVIIGILKNALGIQQIPPNMALSAIALILAAISMTPTSYQIADNFNKGLINYKSENFVEQVRVYALEPYRDYLKKNTSTKNIIFFKNEMEKRSNGIIISDKSLLILLPSYLLDQLQEAFTIGFLLYLPFIAIDLIISNILLALGMMMVSPVTISIPFKILLFIVIGGWKEVFSSLLDIS